MNRITLMSVILILCIMAGPAMAQVDDTALDETGEKTYTHVPFSLSFVPNVSIGGLMGGDIITNVSINVLAGRYAKLRGVEFGSILNWETEEVTGVQFSGVANFLEQGDLNGIQVSGVANYVGRDVITGGQIGNINYVGGAIKGGQIGNVNYVADSFNGPQIGNVNYIGGAIKGGQMGNVNYVGDSIHGFQIGTVNYVNYIGSNINRGAQIGVVNVGGEIAGSQIGVVNIARKVRGAQIGVVNYADEMDGAPVGIFSFVRKGQIHMDVWASDTSMANIALKTGSKHVYSILAAGYQPPLGDDPYRWSTGIGIGGHIPFGSKFVNIEALSFHVNEDKAWENDLHMINKLRLIGGWEVNPKLSVFAGLTLNVFVSEVNDGDHIATGSFYDHDGDDTWVRMWPGFVAGVQF
ncbi:hypothetical protein ACFL6S_34050 [Candidatus Poribacteria bacterium]